MILLSILGRLPAHEPVSHFHQALLGIKRFVPGTARKFEFRRHHDGGYRARINTKSAEYAPEKVQLVRRHVLFIRLGPLGRYNGNGIGGTDRLAQAAPDAPLLLARLIAEHGVKSPRPGKRFPLLEGVLPRDLRLEHGLERQRHTLGYFKQEDRLEQFFHSIHLGNPLTPPRLTPHGFSTASPPAS